MRAPLMGGEACVFYGAAEFSRDTDVSPHVRRRSAMTLITIKPVPSNRTRVLGENNPSQYALLLQWRHGNVPRRKPCCRSQA